MTSQVNDPNDPLLLACRDVGRAMDLFDETVSHALNIGRSDLRALNALEHGPLSAAVLADRIGLTRASVTTLIDRLESANYVSRSHSLEDRRVVKVQLLPATWDAFARIYRPLGQRVQTALADLTLPQRDEVIMSLTAMVDAFTDACAQLNGKPPSPEPSFNPSGRDSQ